MKVVKAETHWRWLKRVKTNGESYCDHRSVAAFFKSSVRYLEVLATESVRVRFRRILVRSQAAASALKMSAVPKPGWYLLGREKGFGKAEPGWEVSNYTPPRRQWGRCDDCGLHATGMLTWACHSCRVIVCFQCRKEAHRPATRESKGRSRSPHHRNRRGDPNWLNKPGGIQK